MFLKSLLCSLFFASLVHAQSPVLVLLPLTGPMGYLGEAARNGFVLADEEFDAQNHVQFIFEDDQFQPQRSLSTLRQVQMRQALSGVSVFGTGSALAIAPLIEQSMLPTIAISIDPRVVQGRNYLVKLWVDVDAIVDRIVSELRTQKVNRLALVATQQDAMLAIKEGVERRLPGQVIFGETFAHQDMDFRAAISRLVVQQPEQLGIILLAPQAGIFARQARALGFKGRFFGAHNLESADEIAAAQGALDNGWIVTQGSSDADLSERYCKRFDVPPQNATWSGYDSAKLFIEAFQSKKPIIEHLTTVKDFHGAMGTYSARPSKDFAIEAKIFLLDDIKKRKC